MELTDLTVPAIEVRFAPAYVGVNSIFAHAFILTGWGDTLITICTGM